jgi:transketolase
MTNQLDPGRLAELSETAKHVRIHALESVVKVGRGHLGGAFSCIEILVALYYSGFLKIDPSNPRAQNRDYFLMGKGHACISLYPILADLGFIGEAELETYGKNGGLLGGQLDVNLPGVEYNTGSLGHVLGICAGIAKGLTMSGQDNRAIALVGDAEMEEGAIWEAIFFAAEHGLSNLACIIDRNKLSVTRMIDDEILFKNFADKIRFMGWDCHVINGHDFTELFAVFEKIETADKPTMVLANTIKGKGVSFMENELKWHHSVPSEKEVHAAQLELGAEP